MPTRADVAIVGAGLAGAAAAQALGRAGLSVALIDERPVCPPLFRAEKIEPDQADTLRRLGLFDMVRPAARRISRVDTARAGRRLASIAVEQYGIRYDDFVNTLRAPHPRVTPIQESVTRIVPSRDEPRVVLRSGAECTARLALVASGTLSPIHAHLGMMRRAVAPAHSVAFGFTVAPRHGSEWPFEALTYFGDDLQRRVDYLTLFPMRGGMRANLFTYFDPRDEYTRRIADNMESELPALLPGLEIVAPPLRVTSFVSKAVIALFRLERRPLPGVIPIADAVQNTCPATGAGVGSALRDVELVVRQIHTLLDGPVDEAKVDAFHRAKARAGYDAASLRYALWRRELATNPSIRWRLERLRTYALMRMKGGLQHFEPVPANSVLGGSVVSAIRSRR
jgi:2-polyprenyl-6-methoxyphenol hydroxylase-like FAD-dependent oxidoreductase